jgi:hypothetical protein
LLSLSLSLSLSLITPAYNARAAAPARDSLHLDRLHFFRSSFQQAGNAPQAFFHQGSVCGVFLLRLASGVFRNGIRLNSSALN